MLYFHHKALPRRILYAAVAAPFIAFAIFFIGWPWLWYGTPAEWYQHLAEYIRFMGNFGRSERMSFTAFPLRALFLMTPPLALVAAMTYAAIGWRGSREDRARWLLMGCWLVLPLARVAFPQSNFYDSNRHFMEYTPAVSAVAGLGAVWIARKIQERVGTTGVIVAGAMGFVSLLMPIIQYHPYETTYFNFMIGGLGGAQRKALFHMPPTQDIRVNGTEGDYWFSSARDAFRDLRRLNPNNDPIGICGPGRSHAMFNIINDPRFNFLEVQEKGFDQAPLLYVSPRESLCWWRQVRRWERERSILVRVTKGDGLIYEILGPKDGVQRIPISPETEYERSPDPRDRDGLVWFKDPNSRSGMAPQ
jgi:hypothetical protein